MKRFDKDTNRAVLWAVDFTLFVVLMFWPGPHSFWWSGLVILPLGIVLGATLSEILREWDK